MRLCVVWAVDFAFVLLRMCQLYSCVYAVVLLCSFTDRVYFLRVIWCFFCVSTVMFSVCNLNLCHCNLNLRFIVFVVCRPKARQIIRGVFFKDILHSTEPASSKQVCVLRAVVACDVFGRAQTPWVYICICVFV